MPRWETDDLIRLLRLYPNDTSSIFLHCEMHRPKFQVLDWEIENCEFRLCRGTELTEDLRLFMAIPHDDLHINIIELYYVKADSLAVIHIFLDTRTIINIYNAMGPTRDDLEAHSIPCNEMRYERMRD